MEFEDGTVVGRFANGRAFLDEVENVMPCVNQCRNYANLTREQQILLGKEDKIITLYENCRKAGVFLSQVLDNPAQEFQTFEELKSYFASRIDDWISFSGLGMNKNDPYFLEHMNFVLYDPDDMASSLFNCLH
ncbi:MAG: hypothetical protein MJ200_05845 [Mycoplasmoidaceae bacterium]|nr:hypothetical protein [Mycoplasmoidaceae bacterium]